MRQRRLVLVLLALLALAALPRLYELGALSFYADEETTAFPARALAEGGEMRMPSGMPYLRAVPLTWLNALSARVLGVEEEISYRLPTALLGALTVPLLFLLGVRVVGAPAALVAALLLAGSEWHLVFSRQARMYAPMLCFVVAAAAATWVWAERGRRRELLLASGLFSVAVSLHALAALTLVFALAPLVLSGGPRPRLLPALSFSGFGAVGTFGYIHLVESAGFRSGPFGDAVLPAEPAVGVLAAAAAAVPLWRWPLAAAGAALGAWLAVLAEEADAPREDRAARIGRGAGAAAAGALAGAGHLYGASLAALVFLLLHPAPKPRLARRVAVPAVLVVILGLASAAAAMADLGVVAGAKSALMFPFPYVVLLARQSLGITALLGAAVLWMALAPHRPERRGLRACVLAVVVGVAAVGAARAWGGTRYLLPLYPFVLLAASAALVAGLERAASAARLRRARPAALAAAVLVAASGVLGGHGAPQAVRVAALRHGERVNARTHMVPFRPDHAAAGRFLAEHRAPGDVVVAEDPLEQGWYAGPVDYWLRSFADARQFLYRAPDGALRDVYVNSALLRDPASLDPLLASGERRIWLVTSGETLLERTYYLDAAQRRWLDSVQAALAPAFTGRDGATRVYCLNCSTGTPARSGARAP